jgi:ADP-ribose pyrophosphatase YjhB (NUDIX family)
MGAETTNPQGGEARRFARLAEGRSAEEGYWPLPPDGLCLSSFLVLSPSGIRTKVLVGKIDPRGPWGEIGALNPHRIQLNSEGWMLPSCHLLYFESPRDAAIRVLREQLGLENLTLEGPSIFSEKYRPRRHPERGEHWDLEFVFRGEVPTRRTPAPAAWKELRFIDPSKTARSEFTRSHDEVLELAGFAIG